MVLAAGEGRRMRPLTLTCPKPLLDVAGRSLIEHQIDRLVKAGIKELIINIAYLGEQIKNRLGDGSDYGVNIQYSEEPEPLETGGAIHHALSLLGDDPFLLINADVWLDYPLVELVQRSLLSEEDGFLILVPNPSHNLDGDFYLSKENHVVNKKNNTSQEAFTFSGLSVLRPDLIRQYPKLREKFPLKEVFDWAIQQKRLKGKIFQGSWLDIGSQERLEVLRIKFKS